MKDEIIQKIKEAGVPEQEVETFYNLLSEQILDLLFQDLAEKQTDEELTVIENRIAFENAIKMLLEREFAELEEKLASVGTWLEL